MWGAFYGCITTEICCVLSFPNINTQQCFLLCGGVRKGMETSQRQPQHTGRVLAWWCSSFGTSDSRVHLCQCSPALHPAGLGSWGTPCSVPQCMAEQGTRAGHQPSQICFSGRTCGMLPRARPMFAAGGFVAHSTAMFLSEVPLMN